MVWGGITAAMLMTLLNLYHAYLDTVVYGDLPAEAHAAKAEGIPSHRSALFKFPLPGTGWDETLPEMYGEDEF